MRKPEPARLAVEIHQQVARLLGDPRTGGMGGDPDQVHPPPVHLHHEQHVEPGQADRLDGEEVAGKSSRSLRAQELRPTRPAVPPRRRADAVAAQDPAHRRRRHRDAQLADLADDPDETPSRVLPRQPDHELHHDRIQATRAAFTGVRVCPAAGFRSRCQRNSVVGVTRNADQRCRGSSLASHTSTSRSLGVYRGRLTCRCRTTSWCRNTAISTSLGSVPRLSPTRPIKPRSSNHPTVRTTTAVIFPSRTSTWSGARPRSGTLHLRWGLLH